MTSKEALNEIKDHIESPTWWKNHFKIIEQDLDKLEKLEKVIEILKDKKPDLFKYFRNRKIYTEHFVDRELTEEEYELLKEVFGND